MYVALFCASSDLMARKRRITHAEHGRRDENFFEELVLLQKATIAFQRHYTASSTAERPPWRSAVFWSTATRAFLALPLLCWLISAVFVPDGPRARLATTTVG